MHRYIAFIFTVFLIFSCTNVDVIDNSILKGAENDKIVLTPEEFVSIAYDDPKELSQKEIVNVISEFQCVNKGVGFVTRSSDVSRVVIKKKYYISNAMKLAITRSHTSKKLNVPIFEVEVSNDNGGKDFVAVCGDERAPKVLFYIDNYDPSLKMDNATCYLFELSKNSVLLDIEQIEHIKSEKKDSTLNRIGRELNISKEQISYALVKERIIAETDINTRNNPAGGVVKPTTRIVAFVNPMSKVTWAQGEPYNYAMPEVMLYDGKQNEYEGNLFVGCANVAIGTLFTIIKPAIFLANNQAVDWKYATSASHIFTNEYNPAASSPPELVSMISNLLALIAKETASTPAYETKTLKDKNGALYEKSVITGTETSVPNTISYIRKMAVFAGDENTRFDANLAKQSLFDKQPVFLFGMGHYIDSNHNIIEDAPGHGWLVDGYIMTKRSGQLVYDNYWSVNMGWGTTMSKGYFRTGDNFQNCDVVFNNGEKTIVYYTQEQSMIYNISRR